MPTPPKAPAWVIEPYECSLDEDELKKAQRELNEDPQQRLSQMEALKQWVISQPHLRSRTDEKFLCGMLRGSKWSQLRAREMIENGLSAFMEAPQWFTNINPKDAKMNDLIEKGYCIPLPKRTKEGCQILLYRLGAIPPDPKKYDFTSTIRNGIMTATYTSIQEPTQVHGHVFLFDYTGVTMKHMNNAKLEDLKKWHKIWQKNVPGRFKALHFYNAGSMFEVMASMIKPFLNKKYQERFHVHNTAESLYKAIDKECLPDEYLPDDYTGPSAGTVNNIIAEFKNNVQSKEFREIVTYATDTYWGIDESKKPKEMQASFRKLAVD